MRSKSDSRLVTLLLEAALMLLCALMLVWQLFLPGFIGMANNADFAKVSGPFCIMGSDHGKNNFVFFQSDYERGPNNCYNPHIPTSEIALTWLASSIEQMLGDRSHFDIRWLGAVHAFIYLGFYYALLRLLRPLPILGRVAVALTALWIFGDVSLIAYLNSFYSDVAGILGGLTTVVLAVHLVTAKHVTAKGLIVFGLAALLFVLSKGPQGLFGFLPAVLVLALVWREPKMGVRAAGYALAAALLGGSIWLLASTPDWYRGQARFNLIFYRITKTSQAPLNDLRELGLQESDLRYVGMHSFMPDSPMNDPVWTTAFCNRSSYGQVLLFYLRHPGKALGYAWSDLRDEAPKRRVVYLSNFRRDYGMPAGARTDRLGSWSAVRAWLFRIWPAHILLWFAFVLVLSPRAAMRAESPSQRALAGTILVIALLAAAQFCIASFADACETDRHLLMFHVFTDVTIFLTLLYAALAKLAGG